MLKLVEYEHVFDKRESDLTGVFTLEVEEDKDEIFFWMKPKVKPEVTEPLSGFPLGEFGFNYCHLYYFESTYETCGTVYRNDADDLMGDYSSPVFHKFWMYNNLKKRGWNTFLIRKYLTEISTNFGIFYDADEVLDAENMTEVKTELSLKKLIQD